MRINTSHDSYVIVLLENSICIVTIWSCDDNKKNAGHVEIHKLTDLDNVIISHDGIQRGFELINKIPRIPHTVIKYADSWHDNIIPYINIIRNAIDNSRNTSVFSLDSLERLIELKTKGLINDDEFILAKKKILLL